VIVLDASVLIAHLDESDSFHEAATGLLESTADQELAASAVTVAEVLVAPARHGQLDRAVDLLGQLQVRTLPLSENTPRHLAALRSEAGLKLPDCCVLLAASEAQGAALASFDNRLRSVARSRGLKVLPESEHVPAPPAQRTPGP
jgi:predicted nucleic acid-binding protein